MHTYAAQNNLPPEALRTYFLGNTNVRLTGYNGEEPTDSIRLRDFTIYYSGDKPGLRFNVLRNRFIYRKGEQYSLRRQNYTQEALSRLGVFKYNEFQYVPRGMIRSISTLIHCSTCHTIVSLN